MGKFRNLARLLLGVTTNPALAIAWYRKAAEQGYVDAGLDLSSMYANGRGVPRDLVQAYVWLDRFAHERYGRDGTPPGALERLAAMAAQMTPAQLAEARRLEAAEPPRQRRFISRLPPRLSNDLSDSLLIQKSSPPSPAPPP
ncbi:MAG: tetratricopeptide repeat protein [Caulobacteraceae bacterium]